MSDKLLGKIALCFCFVVPVCALAQVVSPKSVAISGFTDADTYAKVIGGVLTGLGTLFGLPLVILSYKKTRAEIRKLELESIALAGNKPDSDRVRRGIEGGTRIDVDRSPNVNVQIMADPRFLGPLLLLLDFIFASIILTFAGYFAGLFLPGPVRTGLLLLVAGVLLVPIAKEARVE